MLREHRGEMSAIRVNLMLWKGAFSTGDLAATAKASTPTNRVDVNAQNPRRMQ